MLSQFKTIQNKGGLFLVKLLKMARSRCSLVPFLSEIKQHPEQPNTKLFFCKIVSIFVSKTTLVAIGLRLLLKPRLEEKLVLTAKRGESEDFVFGDGNTLVEKSNKNKKYFTR